MISASRWIRAGGAATAVLVALAGVACTTQTTADHGRPAIDSSTGVDGASPRPEGSAAASSSPDMDPSASTEAGAAAGAAGAGEGPTPAAARNPQWGASAPPAGAPFSRAYQLVLGEDARGYHPRGGECSREIHARYWAYGPDGKVYPTWHPPRDPSGCSFGHEHGDDPRTATLFDRYGWPPFGYVNEQLAPSSPSSQRDEDHVGHKVQVGNGRQVIQGDDGRAGQPPSGPVTMVCDSLIKFHQGTHSKDAFTNNLHELLYNVRCTYQDTGQVIETRFWTLPPVGPPGGFTPTDGCSTGEHRHVGSAMPGDSPDTPFPFPGRRIPDEHCAASVVAGDLDMFAMHENWFATVFHRRWGNSEAAGLRDFQVLAYFLVLDPTRYFDPAKPNGLGHVVDLCYEGARGFACDMVRRATDRNGGQRIAWDDSRSPFRGAHRLFAPGTLIIQNEGPSTVYTDAYGLQFSTTPFPGAIEQYISGNRASTREQGFIRGNVVNYAADPADGVRAPN